MAEPAHDDHWSTADSLVYSDTVKSLASLRLSLSSLAESHEFSLSAAQMEKKISEMSDWVEKQRKGSHEKAKKELVQNMGKIATSTVSGIQKMESGDVLGGTFEMVSSLVMFAGETVGGPLGAAVRPSLEQSAVSLARFSEQVNLNNQAL